MSLDPFQALGARRRRLGAMSLDVLMTLRTHDDALVHMTQGGRWITPAGLRAEMANPATRYQVDPSRYYFRTNPLFETGAEPNAYRILSK